MENSTTGGIFSGIGGLLYLVLLAFYFVGLWKLFEKAGKPGWAAIIPIYNIIVLFEIIGKPLWQLILFVIPLANIYVAITMMTGLCKSYGKRGIGPYLLAIFFGFIYIPYLGFSADVRYVGPSEGPNATAAVTPTY